MELILRGERTPRRPERWEGVGTSPRAWQVKTLPSLHVTQYTGSPPPMMRTNRGIRARRNIRYLQSEGIPIDARQRLLSAPRGVVEGMEVRDGVSSHWRHRARRSEKWETVNLTRCCSWAHSSTFNSFFFLPSHYRSAFFGYDCFSSGCFLAGIGCLSGTA
ncbi:hypothetical protein DL93DRAFT_2071107 [Clavulina sp. PMI_390]|nr:hypothetical protein DL93DRAFT_2071107 [Clavulina sp. PMI_390]